MRGLASASLALVPGIFSYPIQLDSTKLPEPPPNKWSYSQNTVQAVFVTSDLKLQIYYTGGLNKEDRSRIMYKNGGIGAINFSFFDRASLNPVGTVIGKKPDGTPFIRLEAAQTDKQKEILDSRYCIAVGHDGTIEIALRPAFIKTREDRRSLPSRFSSYGEGFLAYHLNHPSAQKAIREGDFPRVKSQINFWNKGPVNGQSAYNGIRGQNSVNRSFLIIGERAGEKITAIAHVSSATLVSSVFQINKMLKDNNVTGETLIILDGGGSSSLIKPGFHKHTDGRNIPTMLVLQENKIL